MSPWSSRLLLCGTVRDRLLGLWVLQGGASVLPRLGLPLSPSQVSQSREHQQFIAFLQRLLGPLLEAYSSAAIFIHNFSGPVPEPEFLQKLHKYLITRTERRVAVYGMCARLLALFETYVVFDYGNPLIADSWEKRMQNYPDLSHSYYLFGCVYKLNYTDYISSLAFFF